MLSLDFDLSYRQAESIKQYADEMLRLQNRLTAAITEVRAAWGGETASAYIKKLEAVRERLQISTKQCYSGADSFRARIDAIKEAEEKACVIIKDNEER